MKRSRRIKKLKMSSKDAKKSKTSPQVPPKSPTASETKATELVIDETRKSEVASSNEEEVARDEVKDVKPKMCFDYCDVVARVDTGLMDDIDDDQSDMKIKEEVLDDGNSIEIGEPKIHQEEIAIIVPTKTQHHANVDTESLFETTDDGLETDAQSNNCSMLELEDDDNSSSLLDDDTFAKNNLSLSDLQNSNDESTCTSIETFIDAYEKMICDMDKASQCSFMETYGFIMTFRYVYELPKQKRDKDSEQAINILLGRYTGIDSLDVLQVLLEALNMIGDLDEFHVFELQPVDCILITFLQLKVCISFKDIAKVFKCEEKVAATCFYTTLQKIKKMLKSVIYWPSREETEMTIPKFFKPAYSNVRTIFTNLLVQTGDMPQQQQQQRYVIGFAPSGFVSYISSSYNADTHTDEKIFRLEKLRQRFERNQDALMVLNGFPIENLLGVSNFRVFRPPFIVKKVLPDNKTIVRENFALFKHVTETCSSLQKFQILSLQLKFPSAFVDEVLFSVCVCINYNVMFRNT